MKKTQLEKTLEDQELARLRKLSVLSDMSERGKLLSEIERIHEMRDTLEAHRLDNNNAWVKTLIQTGTPVLATLLLAVVGFAAESNIGNPTGFTLRWLFNRAPR